MMKCCKKWWSQSTAFRVDGRMVGHTLHPGGGVESTRWQSARSNLKRMLILLNKAYIPSLLSRQNQVRGGPIKLADTLALSPAATGCSRVYLERRDISNRYDELTHPCCLFL